MIRHTPPITNTHNTNYRDTQHPVMKRAAHTSSIRLRSLCSLAVASLACRSPTMRLGVHSATHTPEQTQGRVTHTPEQTQGWVSFRQISRLPAGFARSARSRSLRSPSLRLGVLSARLASRVSFFGIFFWALHGRWLDTPPGRNWSTLHSSALQVIHFQRIACAYACARGAKIAPKIYDFYAKS